jgi:hypothetical protein
VNALALVACEIAHRHATSVAAPWITVVGGLLHIKADEHLPNVSPPPP